VQHGDYETVPAQHIADLVEDVPRRRGMLGEDYDQDVGTTERPFDLGVPDHTRLESVDVKPHRKASCLEIRHELPHPLQIVA
jgi:hypothetical protein